MNNCLRIWGSIDPSVVTVQQGEELVAAIEIEDGMISQAYSCKNRDIEEVYQLPDAIDKWAETYSFRV